MNSYNRLLQFFGIFFGIWWHVVLTTKDRHNHFLLPVRMVSDRFLWHGVTWIQDLEDKLWSDFKSTQWFIAFYHQQYYLEIYACLIIAWSTSWPTQEWFPLRFKQYSAARSFARLFYYNLTHFDTFKWNLIDFWILIMIFSAKLQNFISKI